VSHGLLEGSIAFQLLQKRFIKSRQANE